MSDDDLNMSSDEAGTLRRAAKAWAEEGRVLTTPSRRLAALRAQAAPPNSAASTRREPVRVSHWPAAAVALIALGMLGLAVLWGKAPLKVSSQRDVHTVAQDSESPRVASPNPEANNDPEAGANDNPGKTTVEKSENGNTQSNSAANFDTTETLAANASLHIDNALGDVTITDADTKTVTIHATKRVSGTGASVRVRNIDFTFELNSGSKTTVASDSEQLKSVTISVRHRANGDLDVNTVSTSLLNAVRVDYDIRVPRNARLGKISTSFGDIAIRGASGDPELQTVSGSIRVTGTGGIVSAKTSSGDIAIDRTACLANATTSSGGIQVRAVPRIGGVSSSSGDIQVLEAKDIGTLSSVSGEIQAQLSGSLGSAHTSSGDMTLSGAANVGPLSSVSGKIGLKDCGGLLRVDTSSGDLELSGAAGVERLNTVSGDVRADVAALADAALIHTSSGAVQLRLAAKLNATIRAKTNAGSAQSSIAGVRPAHKSDYDVGETLQGVLGDGSHQLTIDTVSGDISLTPLNETAAPHLRR